MTSWRKYIPDFAGFIVGTAIGTTLATLSEKTLPLYYDIVKRPGDPIRNHLVFQIGPSKFLAEADTGMNPGKVSMLSETAHSMGIKDGQTVDLILPEVGSRQTKVYIENRELVGNLVSPMIFSDQYNIEFSESSITFKQKSILSLPPQIPYSSAGGQPIISGRIGSIEAPFLIDTGSNENLITVPMARQLGNITGRGVYPVTIGGDIFNLMFRTYEDNGVGLGVISAQQLLREGYSITFGEYGMTIQRKNSEIL